MVFPDDEAELSPEERRERGKRRRLAEGWLAGESREVTLTPFLIAKYEVTQAQWTAVMGSNPSRFKIGGEDRPVERVSWDDCRRFCETTGLQLPSEARWEYACRGGSDATFGGTGRIDDMGWYMRNSGDRTHPVGRKSPNGFGLHDMHGNVWEWCEDIADWKFHERPESKGVNPVCRSGSGHRAFRGGSFRDGEFHSRASSRARADPKSTTVAGEGSIGFRPVFVP